MHPCFHQHAGSACFPTPVLHTDIVPRAAPRALAERIQTLPRQTLVVFLGYEPRTLKNTPKVARLTWAALQTAESVRSFLPHHVGRIQRRADGAGGGRLRACQARREGDPVHDRIRLVARAAKHSNAFQEPRPRARPRRVKPRSPC